jgi:hypothetical protein
MAKQQVWVGDALTGHKVGDLGFVVELHKHETKSTRYELRGHPARAPAGGETMLYGVVKDSTYTRVSALGIGKVIEVKPNGGRIRVATISRKPGIEHGRERISQQCIEYVNGR